MLKSRTLIGILCIILSLIICFVVTPFFNASVNAKTSIVRVIKPITKGEVITKDDIMAVEVGKYNLPQNVIIHSSDAVGKYATADLMSGDYILKEKTSNQASETNAYLYNLDGTKQAISVSIKSFASGLSGKLMADDIVSVISVDSTGTAVVSPELQYVKVLAVTVNSGVDAGKQQVKQGEKAELPSTVTLLATPQQAKVLASFEAKGNIQFSLVYRGSKENVDKFLKVEDQLEVGHNS
jgi:pilus assembly protein CpaB